MGWQIYRKLRRDVNVLRVKRLQLDTRIDKRIFHYLCVSCNSFNYDVLPESWYVMTSFSVWGGHKHSQKKWAKNASTLLPSGSSLVCLLLTWPISRRLLSASLCDWRLVPTGNCHVNAFYTSERETSLHTTQHYVELSSIHVLLKVCSQIPGAIFITVYLKQFIWIRTEP